jgi:hypothetical protein
MTIAAPRAAFWTLTFDSVKEAASLYFDPLYHAWAWFSGGTDRERSQTPGLAHELLRDVLEQTRALAHELLQGRQELRAQMELYQTELREVRAELAASRERRAEAAVERAPGRLEPSWRYVNADYLRVLLRRGRGSLEGEVRSSHISQHAPLIYTTHISIDMIRDVIGPGGEVIRAIVERTGTKIDIVDDGTIRVASADKASARRAIRIISDIDSGRTNSGAVVRLSESDAFVKSDYGPFAG